MRCARAAILSHKIHTVDNLSVFGRFGVEVKCVQISTYE